jgi:hypothetical protein
MRTTLLILAAALAVAQPARADERTTVIPPDGVRAAYLWTSTLHTPRGSQDSSAAVVLRGSARGAMKVAVTVDGDDMEFDAVSKRDGSLDFTATRHEALVPQLARLDDAARLAASADGALKAGDSWKLVLSEPIPGGTVPVQVVVHVVSAEGGALRLEADGDGVGSMEVMAPPDPTTPVGDPSGARGVPGSGGAPQPQGGGAQAGFPDPRHGNADQELQQTSLDITVHVHLSIDFADGRMTQARGTQTVSPRSNKSERVESEWSLTKA